MSEVRHVEIGAAADTTITVTRVASNDERPQGLVVEADHDLEVNGVSAPRIVLWADRAPDTVHVRTTAAGPVRFWNVWREGELIQAWQGAAHIELDDEGDDLGLDCHDGHGGDRVDLAVRVSFDRAWTQPSDAADGR